VLDSEVFFLLVFPLEWFMLSGEELTAISPSSQVNGFWLDLVWDIDQKYVEIVVGVMIRLEGDIDLVLLLRSNRTLRWHKEERSLL